MAVTDREESPVALRLLRRVTRGLMGQPEVVGADLAVIKPDQPNVNATTLGDLGGAAAGTRADAVRNLLWAGEYEIGRLARYLDYARMYDKVPELKRILKVVVSMVFGGDPTSGEAAAAANRQPFEIVFGPDVDPRTEEMVRQAILILNLPVVVPQIFASGLRYGDCFYELIATIVEVIGARQHLPGNVRVEWGPLQRVQQYRVVPNEGFQQATPAGDTGRPVSPLFMIHYAHERQFGDRYGESLYHSLRDVERQFTATVDVTHVLVVGQGAQRKTVSVQVGRGVTALAIRQTVKEMRDWLAEAPFIDKDGLVHQQVAKLLDFTDKVIPYREGFAKPEFHDEPTPPLDKLLAVAHFDQGRFYLGTGVPKALAGLLDDAHSRAALSEQGMHFAKLLRFWQQDVAIIVLDILVRVMLIADVPFKDGDILIRMNTLSEFNEKLSAEVIKLRAEAAAILGQASVPMRWVLENVLRIPQHLIDPMLQEIDVTGPEDPDVVPGAPENDDAAPTAAQEALLAERFAEERRAAKEIERVLGPLVVKMDALADVLPSLRAAADRLAEAPLWGGSGAGAP